MQGDHEGGHLVYTEFFFILLVFQKVFWGRSLLCSPGWPPSFVFLHFPGTGISSVYHYICLKDADFELSSVLPLSLGSGHGAFSQDQKGCPHRVTRKMMDKL